MPREYKLVASNKNMVSKILIPRKTEIDSPDYTFALPEVDIATMNFDNAPMLAHYHYKLLSSGDYIFTIESDNRKGIKMDVAYSCTPFLRKIAQKAVRGIENDIDLIKHDEVYRAFYRWFLEKMNDRNFATFLFGRGYANEYLKSYILSLMKFTDKSNVEPCKSLANYKTIRGIIMAYMTYKEHKSEKTYLEFPNAEMENIYNSSGIEGLFNYYDLDYLLGIFGEDTLRQLGQPECDNEKEEFIPPKYGTHKLTGELVITDPGSIGEAEARRRFKLPIVTDPALIQPRSPLHDDYLRNCANVRRARQEQKTPDIKPQYIFDEQARDPKILRMTASKIHYTDGTWKPRR